MFVRNFLISSSLIALLGVASQGAQAMMSDDEEEGKKSLAASQAQDQAPSGEEVDRLSDLRGPALERLMHYLTPADEPHAVVNLSQTAKHFSALTQNSRENYRLKAIMKNVNAPFYDRLYAARALPMGDEERNNILSTIAQDESLRELKFGSRLSAAMALPEEKKNQLLRTLARTEDLETRNLINAARGLPTEDEERNAILIAIARGEEGRISDRIDAAAALPKVDEGRNTLLRTWTQDATLHISDRIDAADSLPVEDEGRNTLLRIWANDQEIGEYQRLKAAVRMPDGEEKEQLLQKLRPFFKKKRIENLRTVVQDPTLKGVHRLDVANRLFAILPMLDGYDMMRTLALDSTLDSACRAGIVEVFPEEEKIELMRALAQDSTLDGTFRLGIIEDFPEEERIELLRQFASDPALDPDFHMGTDFTPETQGTTLLRAWALHSNWDFSQRLIAAKALPDGEERVQILQEIQELVEPSGEEVDRLSDLRGPALERLMHYLTPEGEPHAVVNLSTMSNHFKQNTKALRDSAEEEFCKRQRELFARKFQEADIFESMHVLEELTGLYPKLRGMILLDLAGSQNRLLDVDPSQIFDAANLLSGNEKSAVFRALALNPTVHDNKRHEAFRVFAQMIPLSEGLELVRRLSLDETLVFGYRTTIALALPESERDETFRRWALDPERTNVDLTLIHFSSRYGLGEPQGGLDVQLLRSLSQHVNANSRLRVESASELPMDDPVRFAVIHEIAFDEDVASKVRLDAANALPEGEEKTQILQELQAILAQEEEEAEPEDENEVEVIF